MLNKGTVWKHLEFILKHCCQYSPGTRCTGSYDFLIYNSCVSPNNYGVVMGGVRRILKITCFITQTLFQQSMFLKKKKCKSWHMQNRYLNHCHFRLFFHKLKAISWINFLSTLHPLIRLLSHSFIPLLMWNENLYLEFSGW